MPVPGRGSSKPNYEMDSYRKEWLKEEESNFDVRADFDGRGPRWSEIHGTHQRQGSKSTTSDNLGRYRPIGKDSRDRDGPESVVSPGPPVEELVSVPVLGAEWQKAELHSLTRRGQAEEKKEKRTKAWREWVRDQRGLWGSKWLTRRALVFILFAFCAALAITLYFVIPRPPSFSFYKPDPFSINNDTISFSRTPTNFSFSGNLNLLGEIDSDGSSSYLPIHFTHLEAKVFDLTTQKVIATGDYGNHVVPKTENAPVILPVTFSYSALNASDPTWNNVYNSCGHIWTGTNRTDLKFRLELKMSIIGLTTHPISETQLSGIACPFELDAQGV